MGGILSTVKKEMNAGNDEETRVQKEFLDQMLELAETKLSTYYSNITNDTHNVKLIPIK